MLFFCWASFYILQYFSVFDEDKMLNFRSKIDLILTNLKEFHTLTIALHFPLNLPPHNNLNLPRTIW